jgi:hypothetical protein
MGAGYYPQAYPQGMYQSMYTPYPYYSAPVMPMYGKNIFKRSASISFISRYISKWLLPNATV